MLRTSGVFAASEACDTILHQVGLSLLTPFERRNCHGPPPATSPWTQDRQQFPAFTLVFQGGRDTGRAVAPGELRAEQPGPRQVSQRPEVERGTARRENDRHRTSRHGPTIAPAARETHSNRCREERKKRAGPAYSRLPAPRTSP